MVRIPTEKPDNTEPPKIRCGHIKSPQELSYDIPFRQYRANHTNLPQGLNCEPVPRLRLEKGLQGTVDHHWTGSICLCPALHEFLRRSRLCIEHLLGESRTDRTLLY